MRTRSRAAPSGSPTWPSRRRCRDKLDELLLHHNTLLQGLGAATFAKEELLARLLALAPQDPAVRRTGVGAAGRGCAGPGKRILFEGAQAVMLDVDHGTYPFVTSSQHRRRDRRVRRGVGPAAVGFVLGIAKAYTHAGRLRPVPDRAARRDRPVAGRSRPRVRHQSPAAAGAAAGSTRRWCARR